VVDFIPSAATPFDLAPTWKRPVQERLSKVIKIKRIYEEPTPNDGRRILVDRLWPRGLTKEKARVDWWLKEIAPSNELRRWFGHDPARWAEFKARYRDELKSQGALLDELRSLAVKESVTLLYAAKDEEHNNALLLRDLLSQ
jgi:uncharacterized protein YeaO (DUF488 family)